MILILLQFAWKFSIFPFLKIAYLIFYMILFYFLNHYHLNNPLLNEEFLYFLNKMLRDKKQHVDYELKLKFLFRLNCCLFLSGINLGYLLFSLHIFYYLFFVVLYILLRMNLFLIELIFRNLILTLFIFVNYILFLKILKKI